MVDYTRDRRVIFPTGTGKITHFKKCQFHRDLQKLTDITLTIENAVYFLIQRGT